MPRAAVLPVAVSLAEQIARKNMPVLRLRKLASQALEGSEWIDTYLEAQRMSAALVEDPKSEAAVIAALEHGHKGR